MHRTQVYIDEEIFKEAKKKSKILGVSFSEFIRISLKKNIQENPVKDINAFFEDLKPLESFKNLDPEKYQDNIRSNSRLFKNHE